MCGGHDAQLAFQENANTNGLLTQIQLKVMRAFGEISDDPCFSRIELTKAVNPSRRRKVHGIQSLIHITSVVMNKCDKQVLLLRDQQTYGKLELNAMSVFCPINLVPVTGGGVQ